jgi:ParB family transcriptional regulator, chromosome partitioning protein
MKEKNQTESDITIKNVPLEKIHQLENSRVHYHEGDMADLMSSIRQHGLMQPIGIRLHPKKSGEYEILYGNRRFVAMQKLGRDEISCIIVDSKDKTDFVVKNLVENLQRKNLTPFEEGRYFQSLRKIGLSEAEIAARLNISAKQVKTSITVFEHVPDEFQDSINNSNGGARKKGTLNARTAAKIVNNARATNRPRKEIGELLQAAKNHKLRDTQVHLVTKLMREGLNAKQALSNVVSLRSISINILIPEAVITKLEKKHGKQINTIIREHLEEEKEFQIVKRSTIKDAKKDTNLSLSF